MSVYCQTDRFTLHQGDCLTVLSDFAGNSIDSIVTDPPAGISFMGKDWDHNKGGRDAWVAWLMEVMCECLRVLKPGGHALVWAIPRTSHWTGWAIESAGFEIRDRVSHLFGSGFPKSLDVSKAIDAAAGAERQVVGVNGHAHKRTGAAKTGVLDTRGPGLGGIESALVTAPTTEAAQQWNGWGTALKPACEDWWLARKPLEGTVAQNILKHGTGGLNIDGCRIETSEQITPFGSPRKSVGGLLNKIDEAREGYEQSDLGRWPANVITDGSEEVLAAFPNAPGQQGDLSGHSKDRLSKGIFGDMKAARDAVARLDSGSAARFFYCAKASQDDRNEGCADLPHRVADDVHKRPRTELDDPRRHGVTPRQNNHPTVKPTELMRYLCRLVTPPGGIVLDPFCGSGSTGKAAMLEGFRFIGIELSAEYCQLAQRRIQFGVEWHEAATAQGSLFESAAGLSQDRPRIAEREVGQTGLFATVRGE